MVSTEESKVALRVAHLGMIQGAISRVAGFSANAKTFTVTILAGLAAISVDADKAHLGVIGIVSTILLATLDVYYMTLELRFRALYDRVRSRSLNSADDLSISPLKRSGDVRRALNSVPIKLFYLPILAAGVIFIVYGFLHDWIHDQRLPRAADSRRIESTRPRATEPTRRLVQPASREAHRDLGQRTDAGTIPANGAERRPVRPSPTRTPT